MTKDELVKYFSSLDINTLQKLEKYSKLLIIPDEDLLVNATMSQMVEKAHNLADAHFPEWTDRSKSDFGQFLVELFALFSEKDFWYINTFANESILSKMRSYSNVFSRAISMGYTPTTSKGAKAKFLVTFKAGEQTTYKRGELVVEAGGFKFSNDDIISVPASTQESQMELELNEGVQLIEEVSFNGNNIFMRRPNIDLDSIALMVDDISYSRVGTFGFSREDSYHFTAFPEEDGSCSIYFGKDGMGFRPSLGKTVRIHYRSVAGGKGNITKSKAVISDSLVRREAIVVAMISDALGGTTAESITSIREKSSLFYNTKRAAINKSTAEKLLNGIDGVLKSHINVVGNEVYYQIIPIDGTLAVTPTLLKKVEEEFVPNILIGYVPRYQTTYTVDLVRASSNGLARKLVLDVIVSAGSYDNSSVADRVKQVLYSLTNPKLEAEFGKGLSKVDIELAIRSRVDGVQKVTFYLDRQGGEIMRDVKLNSGQIFGTLLPENIEVITNVAK